MSSDTEIADLRKDPGIFVLGGMEIHLQWPDGYSLQGLLSHPVDLDQVACIIA